MSDPESLDLSAEDLMPAWVSGLENSSPTPPASKPRADDSRDHQKGKGNRDERNFDRRDSFKNNDRRQSGRGNNDRRDQKRGPHDRRREDRQPIRAEDIVPQVEFVVDPTAESVKALAKHIRSTNRAYAMAEVAQMVLAASDRYRIIFRVKSDARGSAKKKATSGSQSRGFQLVRCKTDGSVWLSREEAVGHFLNTPDLLEKFYEVEDVKTEAPKGNFSVIAVCGLSGTILGPPNHHEYQQNIANLHRERFGNMPLDKFKYRIEMRRDEETIEQWKEQMSTSRHYRVRTEKPEIVTSKQNADKIQSPVVQETATDEMGGESAPSAESPTEEVDEVIEDETTESSAEGETETPPVKDEPEGASEAEATDTADASENTVNEDEGGGEADESDSISNENDSSAETDENKLPVEEPLEAEPAITSMNELILHFREHFARQIFKEVDEARLPGTISKKELSPALCERMNAEINWQKRGFPLPMVRTLCRKFEHLGLKFFKHGSKALFVTASRPRALSADTVLTDRLVVMLNCIKEKPGALAGDLIKHLQGDTAPASTAAKETPDVPAEPSKKELALLADLRWLLAEGYLIEFPSSELIPGTAVTVNQRKRRPAKRVKKKRTATNKTAVDSKVEDSQPAASPEPASSEPASSEPAAAEPAS